MRGKIKLRERESHLIGFRISRYFIFKKLVRMPRKFTVKIDKLDLCR